MWTSLEGLRPCSGQSHGGRSEWAIPKVEPAGRHVLAGGANPSTEGETGVPPAADPPNPPPLLGRGARAQGGAREDAPSGRGLQRSGVRERAPTPPSSPAGSSSPRSTGRASTRWCHRVSWASCAAPAGPRARNDCAGAAARSGPSASWYPRAPAPRRAARMSRPRAGPPCWWAASPAPGARAGTRGSQALAAGASLRMGSDRNLGRGRRGGASQLGCRAGRKG